MPEIRKDKTFVRGADGSLYLLSKTEAPVKLTDSEAAKLEEILDNAREKFEKILNKEIADHIEPGCAHGIQLKIPHVSME
jgi:hypothetical protein